MAVDWAYGGFLDTFVHLGAPAKLAAPLALLSRFRVTSFGANPQTLCSITGGSGGFNRFEHFTLQLESHKVSARTGAGAVNQQAAFAASDFSLNVWNWGAALYASSTSRQAVFNGVAGAVDANPAVPNPAVLSDTIIGANYTVTPGTFTAPILGCNAEVVILDFVPTLTDLIWWGRGRSPTALWGAHVLADLPFATAATAGNNAVGAPWTVNIGGGALSDCASSPALAGLIDTHAYTIGPTVS